MLERYDKDLPLKLYVSDQGFQKVLNPNTWEEETIFKAHTGDQGGWQEYVMANKFKEVVSALATIASGEFNSIEEMREHASKYLD